MWLQHIDVVRATRTQVEQRQEADRPRPGKQPLVLGIARGGVVVAAEVAALLGAELGVAVARKLGAPRNPELGIGAVSADGTVVLDPEVVEATGASEAYVQAEIEREVAEARRRIAARW